MPVTYTFGGQASADDVGVTPVLAPSSPSITETDNDGVISVGDPVIINGMEDNVSTSMGVSNGGTLYYQGTVTLDGHLVHVFTATTSFTVPQEILGLWEEQASFLDATYLMDVAGGIDTQTFGTDDAVCFAQGTFIQTPEGETPVEKLNIGDLIQTADGRAVPVKWIGRQTIIKVFRGPRAQLVRIKAGALGNHSDLFVTAEHGMVIDDLVINASALVNGKEIDWVSLDDTPDRFTVYHVETEEHDVILANGAPSESYVDMPGRRAFDNFAEYLNLYGNERTIVEMSPSRVSSQRLVPQAIKDRLSLNRSQKTKPTDAHVERLPS